MPIAIQQRLRFAIALGCLLVPGGLFAGDSDSDSDSDSDRYPIELELLSPVPPKKDEESKAIMYRAGWPLTFKATVTDDDFLGIAPIFRDDPFPFAEPAWLESPFGSLQGNRGTVLVLEDPDDQWSYGLCGTFTETGVFEPCPQDETFIEFYPDRGDLRGVWDTTGNTDRHAALADPAGRPEIGGPALPFGVPDGVGYGADDDFPSLVLLSNVGVGIVLEDIADGWEPVVPAQRRNLAGFLGTVGYELSDQKLRTSVTASMIVPQDLFSRIKVVDPCVGAPVITFPSGELVGCDGDAVQRRDGGPIELEQSDLPAYNADGSPAEGRSGISEPVEIRAFLVASIWVDVEGFPRTDHLDTVTDMDGDGVVGAADAELAGWTVVSNEIVYEFRQYRNSLEGRQDGYQPFIYCFGQEPYLFPTGGQGGYVIDSGTSFATGGSYFIYDIDGNYLSAIDISKPCPPGSGGTTQVPRGG